MVKETEHLKTEDDNQRLKIDVKKSLETYTFFLENTLSRGEDHREARSIPPATSVKIEVMKVRHYIHLKSHARITIYPDL